MLKRNPSFNCLPESLIVTGSRTFLGSACEEISSNYASLETVSLEIENSSVAAANVCVVILNSFFYVESAFEESVSSFVFWVNESNSVYGIFLGSQSENGASCDGGGRDEAMQASQLLKYKQHALCISTDYEHQDPPVVSHTYLGDLERERDLLLLRLPPRLSSAT